MGFSRDFDRITITDDNSTIRVEGTSLLDDVTSAGDPATAIKIAIVALPFCDVTIVSEPVDVPVGAQWRAMFPGGVERLRTAARAPAPGNGGTPPLQVYVIGVAEDPELDMPYVWGESHSLVTSVI